MSFGPRPHPYHLSLLRKWGHQTSKRLHNLSPSSPSSGRRVSKVISFLVNLHTSRGKVSGPLESFLLLWLLVWTKLDLTPDWSWDRTIYSLGPDLTLQILNRTFKKWVEYRPSLNKVRIESHRTRLILRSSGTHITLWIRKKLINISLWYKKRYRSVIRMFIKLYSDTIV